MSRIFLSHASADWRAAVALKQWLAQQDPTLAGDIFLDVDPVTGIPVGVPWKDALRRANTRCEAVICLVSSKWEASHECKTEYRVAETLNKQIFCARLEPSTGDDLISEWQRCDLFGDDAPTTVDIGQGVPVQFATAGLNQLLEAVRDTGIGPQSFHWPPVADPERAPYRGWEPFEQADAAVFFGRDAQIVRALDAVRGMRLSGLTPGLFVVLGPSGTGKSSFLRAGLLPRLEREDRRFVLLQTVRPERNALTGERGLAAAIHASRRSFGLTNPALGDIKAACSAEDHERVTAWLTEIRDTAAAHLLDDGDDDAENKPAPPTLVLPIDQAEELFSADARTLAEQFLRLLRQVLESMNESHLGMLVAATIRTDRYEVMQTDPELADIDTVVFDELKPMPANQFKEVITGPAERATQAGHALKIAPDLVERLLDDAAEGADTLPILSLTLSRLYLDYGSSGELTVAQYEAMGGMSHVVQSEIDSILSTDHQARQEQLKALRAAFIPWLATINPNDQAMRRQARWTDLPEASRGLIDALVARRLMVKDTRDGEVVVEVALESLLRQWDDLAGWLAEQRHNLKAADDLENAAAAWTINDHSPDWLLSGARLADAEILADTTGFGDRLSKTRGYLSACREAEDQRTEAEEKARQAELMAAEEAARHAEERQATAEAHTADLRRRSRVLRAVLAATAIVAVIAIVVGVMAVVARKQAQDRLQQATGLRIAGDGQAMLAGNRPGGDILALQLLTSAATLAPDAVYAAVYSAAVSRAETLKIIETRANAVVFIGGDRLATAYADGTVQLWNARTGLPLGAPVKGHELGVTSLAFKGGHLVTGSSDGTVRLWNAETGAVIGAPLRTQGGSAVTSVAISGKRVAGGSEDGTVQLWDADTGAAIGGPFKSHDDWVTSVEFSSDGRLLAAGNRDGTVQLWSTDSRTPVGAPLAAHHGAVNSVAFSAQRLATAGEDGMVRLWNTGTWQPVGAPLTGHKGAVKSVAFSDDGQRLASAGQDATVRIWDGATGAALGQPLDDHTDAVTSVAFDNGHRLVSASEDATVRVWNADATVPLGQPLTGHAGTVTSVAFKGRRLATGGSDGYVRLWSADNGTSLGAPLFAHPGGVNDVAFGPVDNRLATAGADGKAVLWNIDTGRPVWPPFTGTRGAATAVALSEHRMAVGGAEGTVQLWNTDTGQRVGKPIAAHTDQVNSVAFDPSGHLLATAGADGVGRLWNVDTGEPHGDPLIGHDGWVTDVAFSPDGRILASAGRDDVVRLWDVDTGKPVGEPLRSHTNWVNSVAFSPDGRLLATASSDGTARLWDAHTGAPLGDDLRGHTGDVTSVAFSPDGDLLATTGQDASVRVWLAGASKDDLCAKLTHNMSDKQWKTWVPNLDYSPACQGLTKAE
ncbi:MAG TPA: TIR domain-containing protein [Mycobacterium sp.]